MEQTIEQALEEQFRVFFKAEKKIQELLKQLKGSGN